MSEQQINTTFECRCGNRGFGVHEPLCPFSHVGTQHPDTGTGTHPSLEDMVAAKPVEDLRKHYVMMLRDTCDDDTQIRELARPILGDKGVDGDSYCVPPITDIVEELTRRLATALAENAELQADKERLDWLSGGDRITAHLRYQQLTLNASSLRTAIDAARTEEAK